MGEIAWAVLCDRLEGYIAHRWSRAGLARPRDPTRVQRLPRMGCSLELVEFAWVTFHDDECPQAVGIRLLSNDARDPAYEVVERDASGILNRSEWRFQPRSGWRQVP